MEENLQATTYQQHQGQEQPRMSEISTLFNIFIEPSNTFEDLRRKPRFILALLISAVLFGSFMFGLVNKIPESQVRDLITQQMEKSPWAAQISKEDKAKNIEGQVSFMKYTPFIAPLFMLVFSFIGGLVYFLGAKAFGGVGGYLHGLSVWVYSQFAPTAVAMIANLIVLVLKPAEEIDLLRAQKTGLLNLNLSFLSDPSTQPVLTTILSVFDVFLIWGWILAVIGLSVTNRLSKAATAALVIILALLGISFRVIGAFMSGAPS